MTSLSMQPGGSTRRPAVAGLFYPADPAQLRGQLTRLLGDATAAGPPPKALIAPHAGYIYSGPVAARAYARLAPRAGRIERVVLLGPAHRVPVRGIAVPSAEEFATPLGAVAVDQAALAQLRDLPQVVVSDRVHDPEHSLEVHLPFLQQVLGAFRLVPLVVGEASPEQVAEVLARLWGGPETLIVVSTDLSHYLPYAEARATDHATVGRILGLTPTLAHDQACGATSVNGLLAFARGRGLRIELLDLRNSGDTAGDRSRVVGYAALALHEPEIAVGRGEGAGAAAEVARGATLLAHAREAIAQRLALPAAIAPQASFLDRLGATFVTLRLDGELRGCIGSLQALRPLRDDVRDNAMAAAFDDPRFAPLSAREFVGLRIEVSVLSPATPIVAASESELQAQLRPGIDGVTLQWRGRRGTFLPQVWSDVATPAEFLQLLKRKAGLPADYWSDEVAVSRYTVDKFTEGQPA